MTTFDGIDYGGVQLVPKYYYHPSAPSAGDVASLGLAGAYMYSRLAGRLIGYQTYRHYLAAPNLYANVALGTGTSLSDIASFRRRLPEIAGVIRARAWVAPRSQSSGNFGIRIVATDGTNTDTGTEYSYSVGGAADGNYHVPGQQHPSALTRSQIHTVEAYVELANVSLPATCTVDLEARCTQSGSARQYRVIFAVCWWEVD